MTDTARSLLDAARARLAAGDPEGLRRERLGERVTPRRVLGLGRGPRISPVGSAWHLGALLVADDAVLATGDILRASDPGRKGFAAESARQRAETAREARRGGFSEGETVHIDWTAIDLDALAAGHPSGPLSVVDGRTLIRWSPRGATMPLAVYLSERVDLLLHPPQGA